MGPTTMTKPFPYWLIAALVMAIAIVQVTADHWHLYFYIWWLDIPVHMTGGFWIGITSLVLYFHTRHAQRKDRTAKFSFIVALTAAFAIGASWEVFEYVVDRSLADGGIDLVDSLSDIVNDGIGASLATAFFLRRGYNKAI